jgi:hypothetical protein
MISRLDRRGRANAAADNGHVSHGHRYRHSFAHADCHGHAYADGHIDFDLYAFPLRYVDGHADVQPYPPGGGDSPPPHGDGDCHSYSGWNSHSHRYADHHANACAAHGSGEQP